jgi:hypothetical protein
VPRKDDPFHRLTLIAETGCRFSGYFQGRLEQRAGVAQW